MARILVVDDNFNHRTLIEQELTEEGHDVVVTSGGTEAMSYVNKHRPDLVITDVAMPRYTGIELIQSIQKHDPTIPIIIYSGYSAYEYTYMAWSVEAFVLKSGDVSELKKTVNVVMERASNRTLWQAVGGTSNGLYLN